MDDIVKMLPVERLNSYPSLWLYINKKLTKKQSTLLSQSIANDDIYKELALLGSVDDSTLATLSDGIVKNTRLTTLDLSGNNNITSYGAKYFVDIMNQNKIINTLKLHINKYGDEGVGVISKGLETNNTITELHLADVDVGDEGIITLASALKTNNTLTFLNLSNNDNISDDSIVAIADMLKVNNSIAVLNLSDAKYEDEESVVYFAEALKYNTGLTYLSFNNRLITQRIIDAFIDMLNYNNTIEHIIYNEQTYLFGVFDVSTNSINILDSLLERNKINNYVRHISLTKMLLRILKL